MNIEDVKKSFNFNENAYFYHITGDGIGEEVLEEGLLVDGNNILDVDNIIFTTAIEITPDMVDELEDILDEELHEDSFRGTSEMIILGCSKKGVNSIVTLEEQEKDGVKYDGIVFPNLIMGYFNIDKEFTPNELFDYGSDYFYEDHDSLNMTR